jgi:uncharacterized protein (TIGR02246 family)
VVVIDDVTTPSISLAAAAAQGQCQGLADEAVQPIIIDPRLHAKADQPRRHGAGAASVAPPPNNPAAPSSTWAFHAVIWLAGKCTGPQDACQQLVDFNEAQIVAFNKKDAAAVAALYTEDAVFVTEGPILYGRAAIEKFYADGIKGGDSNLVINFVESRIMGDEAWAIGDWNVVTSHGPIHGNWVTLFVRDRGAWKMRVDTFNVIEASPK